MTTTGTGPDTCPPLISFAAPGAEWQRYSPPAERIVAGDPAQSAATLFQSADGRFSCGIWECQPGKWRVVFTESEFCHLLAGVLEVCGDDGSAATFRAGDAFVSPAGFTGTWEVKETARKYFAFYE